MRRLVAGLLTPLSLAEISSGAQLLDLLIRTAPDLTPEFCGNFEPVRTPFRSIEEVPWKSPFLWKRTTGVRADGAVWFANPDNHSATYLRVAGPRQPTDQVVAFVQASAVALSLDFAYVHLMTEKETKAPRISYDMWYPIDIGVTSTDLRKGVPNVCWAMVLGPPYVRMIGREKLLSAPCFAVRELSDEHLYLQLTARVEDVHEDFEGFDELRHKLKAYLGESVFLAPNTAQSARAVPTFTYGDASH